MLHRVDEQARRRAGAPRRAAHTRAHLRAPAHAPPPPCRIDGALRSELTRDVYQTWNPVVEPAKAEVIADYSFERPVVTKASVQALRRLEAAQGARHVWLVGAYSRYSMPLLENGVKSGMVVARRLGIDTSDLEVDDATGATALEPKPARRAQRRSTGLLMASLLVPVAVGTLAHVVLWMAASPRRS